MIPVGPGNKKWSCEFFCFVFFNLPADHWLVWWQRCSVPICVLIRGIKYFPLWRSIKWLHELLPVTTFFWYGHCRTLVPCKLLTHSMQRCEAARYLPTTWDYTVGSGSWVSTERGKKMSPRNCQSHSLCWCCPLFTVTEVSENAFVSAAVAKVHGSQKGKGVQQSSTYVWVITSASLGRTVCTVYKTSLKKKGLLSNKWFPSLVYP